MIPRDGQEISNETQVSVPNTSFMPQSTPGPSSSTSVALATPSIVAATENLHASPSSSNGKHSYTDISIPLETVASFTRLHPQIVWQRSTVGRYHFWCLFTVTVDFCQGSLLDFSDLTRRGKFFEGSKSKFEIPWNHTRCLFTF